MSETLKPVGSIKFLGALFCRDGIGQVGLMNRIQAGWGKFWQYRNVLCNPRVHWRFRIPLLTPLVFMSVLWSSGSWVPQATVQQRLRSLQTDMVRRIIGRKRAPLEPWLHWWRRGFREASQVIADGPFFLSHAARTRHFRLAGHAARSACASPLGSALHWRSQEWWRHIQEESRGLGRAVLFARPLAGRPSSWEMELEARWGPHWMELAQDREFWHHSSAHELAL